MTPEPEPSVYDESKHPRKPTESSLPDQTKSSQTHWHQLPTPDISRQNTSIITSEPAPISVSSGRPKLELEAPASSILETFKSLLPPGIWPTAKAEDFHIDSEEDEEEEGADSESETEERGRGQDQEGEGQKRGRSTSGSTRERKKQRVYWSKS